MADFLTRLAERTLGVAPMVQPMFTPEPLLTSDTHPLQHEDISMVQPMIAPELSSASEALNLEHKDRAVDTVRDNIVPAMDRPSPAALRLLRHHSIHPQTPKHAAGQSFLEHNQDVHASHEQVKHTPRGPSPELEGLTRRSIPAVESGIVPAQGATASTSSLVSSSTVSEAIPNEVSLGTYLSTNRTSLTRALLPAQHLEVSAAEKSTSAPTIRVTIGRIEVRAIMPTKEPTARPPSTRPRPKLSLDDYLKQQNGGQR